MPIRLTKNMPDWIIKDKASYTDTDFPTSPLGSDFSITPLESWQAYKNIALMRSCTIFGYINKCNHSNYTTGTAKSQAFFAWLLVFLLTPASKIFYENFVNVLFPLMTTGKVRDIWGVWGTQPPPPAGGTPFWELHLTRIF